MIILDRRDKVRAIFGGLVRKHHAFFAGPVFCDLQCTVFTTTDLPLERLTEDEVRPGEFHCYYTCLLRRRPRGEQRANSTISLSTRFTRVSSSPRTLSASRPRSNVCADGANSSWATSSAMRRTRTRSMWTAR